MMVSSGLKRLLIVDDSQIDRIVLKNALGEEFEIIEADNGYDALDILMSKRQHLDALLLDISMPRLDGFDVLQRMKERNLDGIPVFLITSEATKANIEKAAPYNISEFLRKPFDQDEIRLRLRSRLGILPDPHLTEEDIRETRRFIVHLEGIYRRSLANFGDNSGHYFRLVALMRILLEEYCSGKRNCGLDEVQIEFISRAACFCDMGSLLVPVNYRTLAKDEAEKDSIYQSHTLLGASMVRLNYSEHCDYFVQVCADMCMHHHERYDGTGYPHHIAGDNNLIYTQMCRLVEQFDSAFTRYHERTDLQFDFVTSVLNQDKGLVSREVFQLLLRSKHRIVGYYNSTDTVDR